MIDQWCWKVFSGEIAPADYNKAWWALRLKIWGIAPPMARSEADFDPGAKYHVAANVPYTRYFLAHILEFQFYRALCRESGYKGPLNHCSPFYGSKEAGAKFNKMLAMGQSKPWPDALERHRQSGSRCQRDPGVFRAAARVAGRAEQGKEGGLVGERFT